MTAASNSTARKRLAESAPVETDGLADALTAALGCQFNEWSECTVHWTEATPRGYDEPTCGVASKALPILAARIEQARAEGAAEVVARIEMLADGAEIFETAAGNEVGPLVFADDLRAALRGGA